MDSHPQKSPEDLCGYIEIFGKTQSQFTLQALDFAGKKMDTILAFAGYMEASAVIVVASEGDIFLIEGCTLLYWARNFEEFLEKILVGKKRSTPPLKFTKGEWDFPRYKQA